MAFAATLSHAQTNTTNPSLCNASQNLELHSNIEKPQTDGSIIFEFPGCNIMNKNVPIVLAYTHIPLEEVNAGYYCKLKGFKTVVGVATQCRIHNVVDLKDDGTVLNVSVGNTCSFKAIACSNKI